VLLKGGKEVGSWEVEVGLDTAALACGKRDVEGHL
jgi:hypothetical protein